MARKKRAENLVPSMPSISEVGAEIRNTEIAVTDRSVVRFKTPFGIVRVSIRSDGLRVEGDLGTAIAIRPIASNTVYVINDAQISGR